MFIDSFAGKSSGSSNPLSDFSSDEIAVENPNNVNLFDEEIKQEDASATTEEPGSSPEAQDFADEMVAYTSSCGDGIAKEELLQDLKKITQKYPSVKDSHHKYELSQLIAISSENYCSVHLSADELSELWNG